MFLAKSVIHPPEFFCKFFIYAVFRFPHQGKDWRSHMFGRHFELPAYMMLAELAEEIPLFVSQQIVETDSGSYLHTLGSGGNTFVCGGICYTIIEKARAL